MTICPSLPRNGSQDSESESNIYGHGGRGVGSKPKASTVTISMKLVDVCIIEKYQCLSKFRMHLLFYFLLYFRKPVGENDYSITGEHYDPHAERDVDHPTS